MSFSGFFTLGSIVELVNDAVSVSSCSVDNSLISCVSSFHHWICPADVPSNS